MSDSLNKMISTRDAMRSGYADYDAELLAMTKRIEKLLLVDSKEGALPEFMAVPMFISAVVEMVERGAKKP